MANKKGFSGFDSLMSDVDPDEVLQNIPASTPERHEPTASPQTDEKPTIYQQKSAGNDSPNKAKAFWWIVGIIFVIWIISQEDSGTSSSSSSRSSSSSYQSNSDSYAETESMPPVGQNNILNRSQIRYCLSQEIRIDTIQNGLNNYSDYEVSMFNSLVNDYNSRCGSFRYSSGSLESVRRQVEANRSSITAQGYATIRTWRGQ